VRLPGAEDCVAGDALAREVELKLNRAVFPAARDSEALIEGHVQRGPEGYRAELLMSRGDGSQLGSRVLTSSADNCRELSETLGVVLAVMIDPEAEGHVRPPATAKPVPAAPPPSNSQPATRAHNDLMAFARVLIKVVPEPSVGFGVAYQRTLGAAGGLRIEGVSFFERRSSESLPDVGPVGVGLRLAYAGIAYCPLWIGPDRVRLAGCAGLEVGAMRAQGLQLARGRERTQVWLSGSAALRLDVRLVARLVMQLAASFVGTAKHSYSVMVRENGTTTDQPSVVARGAAFGAAFDLGLGARF
jgi:hypothetical protein